MYGGARRYPPGFLVPAAKPVRLNTGASAAGRPAGLAVGRAGAQAAGAGPGRLLARRSARAPEPLASPRTAGRSSPPDPLPNTGGQVKPANPSSRTVRALRVHRQQLAPASWRSTPLSDFPFSCTNRYRRSHECDNVQAVALLLEQRESHIQPRLLLRTPAEDLVDRQAGGAVRYTLQERIPGRCPRPPPRSPCLRQRSCGSPGPELSDLVTSPCREDALNRG